MKIAAFCFIAFISFNFHNAKAQELRLKIPAASPGQRIEQDFGLGTVSIKYYRPNIKGRKIWHGPGDVSPVGHAAHAHIDLAVWNFGIQEAVHFSDKLKSVFTGCPTMNNGYMSVNEVPGLGVDINEKEAAKYPITTKSNWQVRKSDGTIIRP